MFTSITIYSHVWQYILGHNNFTISDLFISYYHRPIFVLRPMPGMQSTLSHTKTARASTIFNNKSSLLSVGEQISFLVSSNRVKKREKNVRVSRADSPGAPLQWTFSQFWPRYILAVLVHVLQIMTSFQGCDFVIRHWIRLTGDLVKCFWNWIKQCCIV